MISEMCMQCLMDRQQKKAAGITDETKRREFLKELERVITQREPEASVPVLSARLNGYYATNVGEVEDYSQIKRQYNQLVMDMEPKLLERIERDKDPLRLALILARIGNYIDFGIMREVETSVLEQMLRSADRDTLDEKVYEQFLKELEHADSLVYLPDNCGEVVLDKLVIQKIKERYPKLKVTAIVRGKDVVNDATREDAVMVGLDLIADRLLDNGTQIGGTYLPELSIESRQAIQETDLILAKGQGNFETMNGCGLNVYYLFLCKCDWFVQRFDLPRNTGVFIREKDLDWAV